MLKKSTHDQRTIIVLTRLSESELHVTYCNALTDDQPYVLTVELYGPPFTPTGAVQASDIPEVGHTKAVWT